MIDSRGSTISNAAAFYLWPLVLIDDSVTGGSIQLEGEVFRRTLRQGISVKVLREGIFVFDFSNRPADEAPHDKSAVAFDTNVGRVVRRVSVMNAYLACFYTAFYRLQQTATHVMRIPHSDLQQFGSLDDPSLEQIARGCPDVFIRAVRTDSNWRLAPRSVVVRIDTIEASFQQFDLVLDEQRTDMIALADLYLWSCLACSEHDYSLALITAWATIEKLLSLLFTDYVQD